MPELRVAVPPPFELRLVLYGHGWIDLPPHEWDEERRVFTTALLAGGEAADVQVSQQEPGALAIEITTARAGLRSEALAAAGDQVARMLRVNDDLAPFWSLCEGAPHLSWVPRRGAGRLMRSPGLFEDLMKLLFTTNCSWAATRSMTRRLVAALGETTPSGKRTFPTAEVCAAQPASFYREEVRAGYRAEACHELAVAFAEGRIDAELLEDRSRPAGEVRDALLALRGFGPYAAGQALRLLGHYEDLALDSWCRARIAKLFGKKKPPSDRTIARRYRSFGRYQGLAMWMELTAEWHGEPR